MIRTSCAICGDQSSDTEVYSAALTDDSGTFGRFSARRNPDRVHFRIVQCRKCTLLRSDPIFADEELARLYGGSSVTYRDEAQYAGDTYVDYMRRVLPLLPQRERLLEIGCGHGFFLERALALGFDEVLGVEPSREAVEIASPLVRHRIRTGVFSDGLFEPGSFDVVCAFQVFDHLPNPNEVLDACRRVLRPGGLALFINHDASAWTNRLLGERSPIIDIQHIYLYNRQTMRRIFLKHQFEVLDVFPVRNRYPIYYWCHLSPLPSVLKRRLVSVLRASRVGRCSLAWQAGNLGLLARASYSEGISGSV